MSDQPFEVGDTVRVKGSPVSAPTMTVTAETENLQGVRVTWYVEGEWKDHYFRTEVLEDASTGSTEGTVMRDTRLEGRR